MAESRFTPPQLRDYLHRVGVRDDPLLAELREQTASLPGGTTLPVSAEQGQFLHLLVGLTGARRVLEIGTYTGYSTLCMARALPPGGTLVTCDVAGRWPRIGAESWRRAGVAERIEVRIGPAAETLPTLEAGFDLVFVDADKTGYPGYHEAAVALVRRGGLVVFDNTLFFGRVADPAATDPDTEAVRALNAALHDDERVDLAVLDAADGITLARRR